MEMYVCEKCKEPIANANNLVSCPECGKTYHRRCSLSVSNCICCGCSNMEFESKISEAVKNNATEVDEIKNLENTPYINTETGMFSNIGEKLKGLATVITVIGIIMSIIVFLVNVAMDEDMIFPGLLLGAGIALVSWIGSFAIYGFGALISSTQNTERLTKEMLKEIKNKD